MPVTLEPTRSRIPWDFGRPPFETAVPQTAILGRLAFVVVAADFPERERVDGVSDTATTVSRGKALVTFTLPGKPDANGQRVEATLAGSVTAIYQQIGFRPLRDYRVIHFG